MIGSLEYGGSQAMVINLYKAIDRDKIQFDFIMDKPQNNALLSVVKQLGARVYTLPYFKGNNYIEVKNAWDSSYKKLCFNLSSDSKEIWFKDNYS